MSAEHEDQMDVPGALWALRERYGDAPSYAQLWRVVAAGKFAVARMGRVYRIPRSELPRIAAHFGLDDAGRPDPAGPLAA